MLLLPGDLCVMSFHTILRLRLNSLNPFMYGSTAAYEDVVQYPIARFFTECNSLRLIETLEQSRHVRVLNS